EVKHGKETRIGSALLQMREQVDAVEPFGQHRRRQAAGPFVEIPDDQLGPDAAAIVNNSCQPHRLMTTLAQRRTEMNVIEVDRILACLEIDTLTAARL